MTVQRVFVVVGFMLGVALPGCNCEPPPIVPDASVVDAGPTPPDASVDAGAADDAGLPVDAGQPVDAGADAGVDAGTPVALTDYVPCTLDIDCPSGFGRCLRNLPLHHPDVTGAAAVPAATVFRGLAPGQGVCAESCDQDPAVCTTSPNLTRSVSFSCQVVYSGTSPYQLGTASDAGAMRQGVTFAALCRPPLRNTSFCGACTSDTDCEGGRCWSFSADAGFSGSGALGTCVAPCGLGGSCPAGFSCELRGGASGCFPLQATCGACRDLDQDGFGLGFCGAPDSMGNPTVSSVDCDDGNAQASWQASQQCGPVDRDCNGFIDSIDMVGTDAFGAQHCAACNDACPTAVNATIPGLAFACVGPVGNRACVPSCLPGRFDCDSNPDCEVGPTTPGRQWAPDVDGDGFSCNAASGATSCTSITACTPPVTDAGVYAAARSVPDGGSASTCSSPAVCPDADDSLSAVFPGAPERCDGLDNDQDGVVDDGFIMNGDQVCTNGTLPSGTACSGGMRVSVGDMCSATCRTITGPGTWRCGGTGGVVCQPNTASQEVACNGIDDDCDGERDEPAGAACTRPANTLPSPCWEAAVQTCVDAGVLTCVENLTLARRPDLPGDAYDSDCDGRDLQRDALYVWPGGLTGALDGGPNRPLASLDDALRAVQSQPRATIYVQDQVVATEALPLRAGLTIVGGFTNGLQWQLGATPTTICRPASSVPERYQLAQTPVNRQAWVGLRCVGSTNPATPAILQNIRLEVATPTCGTGRASAPGASWGTSIYGAVLRDCDELVLRNVAIVTGSAGEGNPGRQGLIGFPGVGGVGGAGGTVNGPNGQNGSTSLPPAAANTFGGAGGVNGPGSAPASSMFGGTGSQGTGGQSPQPPTLLRALAAPAQPSFYLATNGLLQSSSAVRYEGGIGGQGAFGPGGGGGAFRTAPASIGIPIPVLINGGLGGSGGGGGWGGTGGAPGGDNVGLVLLGTQLFAACGPMDGGLPSACASNFSISVGSPGRGGDGGVGGAGGIGLPGLANTVQGTTGHAGGGGGRGCGGGGGAGGRGGSAIGVLYDTTSRTPAMVLPAWATNVTLTGTPGAGGSANAAGPNGAQYGSNQCSVTTASDGPPGVALTSALVPWRSCADARAIDSDWPDGGSAFVVDAADLVVSTTCP